MPGFNNPILGSLGRLIREKMQSANFVSGVDGWMLAQNGDAELNDVTIRGQFYIPGPNGTYIRGYVATVVVGGASRSIPVIDFGAVTPANPADSIDPGSIFEYSDSGYENLALASPVKEQPTGSPTGQSQVILRSGKSGDPTTAIALEADAVVDQNLLGFSPAVSADVAITINAGTTNTLQAVVFPRAFPAGVTPKIFTNITNGTGASILADSRAEAPSNTGFNLRVKIPSAPGANVPMNVQYMAFTPV